MSRFTRQRVGFTNGQVVIVPPRVGLTSSVYRAGLESSGNKHKKMESKFGGSFINFLSFSFLSLKVLK